MYISNSQKNGIIQLAVLMVLLFAYMYVRDENYTNDFSLKLNEEEQCWVDNQKDLLSENKSKKKHFQYYVNSLNDYKGYIIGMSVIEIDRYLSYKSLGKSIHTEEDFLGVTKMSQVKFDQIKQLLRFSTNKFKRFRKKDKIKPRRLLNLNTLKAKDLLAIGLSKKIAYRVVNYREYLKKYSSIDQLAKVYDITEKDLQLLKSSVYLKN